MLKGLTPPVGVFFETDNLYTLGENTEFMLSFLATFAQEESVKKSESMNWSLAQRFKDGKFDDVLVESFCVGGMLHMIVKLFETGNDTKSPEIVSNMVEFINHMLF